MRWAERFAIARGALLGALGVVAGAPSAWAQAASSPPVPSPTAPAGEAGAGAWTLAVVAIGLLVILVAAVKLFDLKQKREAAAVHLQALLADALLRDTNLRDGRVVPNVYVPLLRGTPATVVVSGQVPASDLRDHALRVVEHEARRIRTDVRIDGRLAVRAD